jgi:hypothetical protein
LTYDYSTESGSGTWELNCPSSVFNGGYLRIYAIDTVLNLQAEEVPWCMTGMTAGNKYTNKSSTIL